MKVRILVVVAMTANAALGHAPMADAQTPMALAPNAAVAVSRGDRNFVETAGQAGMAETEMAKIAQQRGGSVEIKNFADRMIADHGKANQALTRIASAKGIAMPTGLSGADQRALAKIKKLRGRAFDKEYLDLQVSAHKQAVVLFKQYAERGKDADLKAFAALTLPTLREHLKMASALTRSGH